MSANESKWSSVATRWQQAREHGSGSVSGEAVGARVVDKSCQQGDGHKGADLSRRAIGYYNPA